MSRQSKRNEECNLYSATYNDAAESLASAALDNVSISANDDLFKTPETAKGFEGEIIHLNSGATGGLRGGRNPEQGTVDDGNASVQNAHGRHERTSQQDHPFVHHRESIDASPEPQKR